MNLDVKLQVIWFRFMISQLLLNIMKAIKSRKMRWAGDIARVWDSTRNSMFGFDLRLKTTREEATLES